MRKGFDCYGINRETGTEWDKRNFDYYGNRKKVLTINFKVLLYKSIN